MSGPSASLSEQTQPSRSSLRIVLFGMPDAGKSSLLGSLAQAAQTQEHILNGHLTDLSSGLSELQRRLYEESPRETLQEVVPYPVAFEPFAKAGSPENNGRVQAILVDCDGRVANDLLARRRSLNADSRDGTLAQEILDADALILAIDASAPATQINADFTEFGRFLRLLEQQRGHRTQIGGQPVFLVLTKCDLLARPGDSTAAWLSHIKERQGEVEHRFRDFLASQASRMSSEGSGVSGKTPTATTPDSAPTTHSGFGRIDLHPWATAVKRPALADSPPRPREPFGVAELFRQCLDYSRRFRNRREHSSRRLLWTVAGTGALLLGLGALATSLIVGRLEGAAGRLEAKVEKFQVRDQERTQATWHHSLKKDIDDLALFQNDPQFERLPESKKDFVQRRLNELKAYQQYEKGLDQIGDPKDARNEEQLKQIEAKLAQLAPPEEYDWHQTEAYRRRDNWLEDCQDIQDAIARLKKQYTELIERGEVVRAHKNEANLPKRAKEVLDFARSIPDPERDKTRPVRESARVTYGVVFGFTSVENVYLQWKKIRDELEPFAKLEKS
jgi:GTPase SAR1 family protein